MAYMKMTLEVIIHNDDAEILEQALNNAMDEIEGQLTVYASSIMTSATGEPEDAAEIAARR
jgi:hypothetical protein